MIDCPRMLPQDHFRRHSPFGSFSMLRPPATVPVMADTPLPGPESERISRSRRWRKPTAGLWVAVPPSRSSSDCEGDSVFLQAASADAPVSSVIRGLREYFEISALVLDGEERNQLPGWAGSRPVTDPVPISARLKAQALASGRCELCGKTPRHHNVVLEVDLRVPADWGGTNDPENLWALCKDCHVGWRQYLQTYAPYTSRSAMRPVSTSHRDVLESCSRLSPETRVPSDLIGAASAKDYQEDYQRRIRDLRFLGWQYRQQKRYHEGARVKSYYRLIHAEPWPENIRAAISAEEKRRSVAKQQNSDHTEQTR